MKHFFASHSHVNGVCPYCIKNYHVSFRYEVQKCLVDTGGIFVGASTVSGFFAAAFSLPFDYVKTQIQKMQPDAAGKYPYTGSVDCAVKTLKTGGPLRFYTGFPVYCVRIAPHVMVCSLSMSLSPCMYVAA